MCSCGFSTHTPKYLCNPKPEALLSSLKGGLMIPGSWQAEEPQEMRVTHHSYKYASTCLSSQEIAFALQIHWLTFCITFGPQRIETREKFVIRVLKPEDLGFCFKCYTKRFSLTRTSHPETGLGMDPHSDWLWRRDSKELQYVWCVGLSDF